MAARGTGLLAVFCDLAPEWLAEFRPWLRRDMFPPRIAIGFGPAASFDLLPGSVPAAAPKTAPQGHVTIYVTPTVGELYGAAYQSLRTVRGPLDAAFHNERMTNQARYVATAVGPGTGQGGEAAFAPLMVVDRFDLDAADAQGFNIWFECEYLPRAAEVPGLVRLTRYLAMEGTPAHLLVHEFADEGSLGSREWQALRAAPAWAVCRHAPGAPAAYRNVAEPDRA